MIGKIIVHGITRDQAITKMQRVLEEIEVQGVKTNLLLLKLIMKNNQFISGNYTTQFLAENKVQVEG